VIFFLVLFFDIFWRFFNYTNRWTLSQDQARDGIIGLYILSHQTLPLLGPPSSAGFFSFGPLYYWLIGLFTLVFTPIHYFGPWIGFTILSIISVLIFYYFGKNLLGNKFGFILGLIAAFVSQDVFNAPDMLNPMLIGFAVSVAFFSLQKIVDQGKILFSVILGLSVGLAINLHFQSLGLLPLLLLTLVFNKFTFKIRIKVLAGILIGTLLVFIPLIYFDILHQGAWITSVANYFISGQNKFNIQTNWITDLVSFWPKLWGEVMVNQPKSGYLFVSILLISLFLSLKNKIKQPYSVTIIFWTFLLQIIMLHFYKGPRMSVYLIVYHPFFIFFTTWSVWMISKYHKILGLVIFLLILATAAYSNWQIVHQDSQAPLMLSIKQNLEKSTGSNSFRILSSDSSFNISLPLYYLLQKENKVSEKGKKIGVCDHTIKRTEDLKGYVDNCPVSDSLLFEVNQYRVFDLDKEENSDQLFEVKDEKIYHWLYSNYPK